MHTSRLIQSILIISAAIVLSIWLGSTIVTDQFATLVKVAIGVLLLTSAFLGRRIWLLFISFSSLNVILYSWFGTTDLGQMLFIVFCLALFLLRELHFELRFGELELWMLLIVACIFQAYVRFPVGLNILGAGNVGGRPYVVLALCIISSFLLSILKVPTKELKWAMWLTLIGTFAGFPIQMARYGSITASAEQGLDRIPILSQLSAIVSRWASSRLSLLHSLNHPFWGLIMVASVFAAASSGYRNSVAAVGLLYLAAIYYHGRFSSLLASLLLFAFALAALALINLNFPLPPNVQRALSPFPGTWEAQYYKAADQSTEWRIEMWKEALFSDRWIHNKVFGDGIGMSTAQLAQNQNMSGGRSSYGLLVQQENMLINGSYHSGPVHSIRMTGYVGLIILLLAMIRTAVHAHRQIIRCRGTEWFNMALFFGIPSIVQPVFFVFIFGEYHTAVAQMTLSMAMIRLMERNLPLPAWKPFQREPYILDVRKHREKVRQPIGV